MFRIALLLLLLPGCVVSFGQTGARLLRQPDISAESVVFVYGGDLWSAPRVGGAAVRMTRTPEAEEYPKFSPDGKWIGFSRGGSVFVMASNGGGERRLTWHPELNRVLGWTPDGKNLLIHSDRLRGTVVQSPHLFLLPVSGGMPRPLPIPRATHGSFAEDGERIAYGPNPEIVLWTPFRHYRGGALGSIATYDLKRNLYCELPRTTANDVFPMWHGDGIYFASDRRGVMNLYRYDVPRKSTEQLTRYMEWDVANPSLGKDAIVFENGGWLFTLDLESKRVCPLPISLPEYALPGTAEQAKWKQALDDAWRAYAEHAFHPAQNWAAEKPRYGELMGWAADVSDAAYVIHQMLAEAGQSHVMFGFADSGSKGPGVGLLGADFELESGLYRVSKIYGGDGSAQGQRGPLSAAGVREGEYIVSLSGKRLDAGQEIYAAFEGLVGKETRIMVNGRPSDAGAREVTVVSVASERGLRRAEWVRENRARVAEASGGRVGYVYVPNVDPEGVESFRKEWMELRTRVDAMIVDIRNCNGGTSPDEVFNLIAAEPIRRMYDRRGLVPPFGFFLDGPKVMIANDQSVSGCDELPMFFKRAKVGPLVGTRTFGGMIGTGATYQITGGGWVLVPEFGFYSSAQGWWPENFGVEPDYLVELRPTALTAGRDPQLEKAIELVMKARQTYQRAPAPPAYAPED
jgi:tricorn protease-like protein/peptidase S41-like protein/WD40 repeat protein